MLLRLTLLILSTLALGACGQQSSESTSTESSAKSTAAPIDLMAKAIEIAHSSIIIDTHIDVPYRIVDEWEDVTVATQGGDFDYPRAVAGGLNAAFMSIYTPASLEATGESKARAEELIDVVERIVATAPDKFAIARTPDDVEAQFAAGLISLPMGMENGSPLAGELANVEYFFARGIRYITLAHSLSNIIADSPYDENKAHGGLSEFGVEVVKEMNRLGMIVDISHVSDDAFWQVMDIATAPAIASHSSARHFTEGWERNMSDDMIKRLAENGGAIMINYGSAFLSQEAHDYGDDRGDAWDAYLEETGQESSDELRQTFNADYAAEHGAYPYATLEQTLDHFDHVVALTGSVDHVGIGTDYDGVGDSLPIDLKDVSSYPNLVHGLLLRGYSEEDIKKILGGNLLRIWRAIEAAAE